MSEYGLTPKGFVSKPLSVIRQEIEAKLRSELGSTINTMPEAVFGQLIGIFAERESDIWDGLESNWSQTSPAKATGVALDDLVAINGIQRLEPTFSRVSEQALIGTIGTIIPQGTQFSVDGAPSSSFITDSEITLVAGADEIQQIDFSSIPSIGDWALSYNSELSSTLTFEATETDVKNALESIPSINEVSVTGDFTSGFSVQFSGLDAKQPLNLIQVNSNSLQDGIGGSIAITIFETQQGVYQGVTTMTATDTGSSFFAPARSITVIDNPVSGLDLTVNPEQGITGRDRETDEELRIRRDQSLSQFGSSTTSSIRAEIEDISQNIEFVKVLENEESVVQNGWKPKSIAVYVHQSGGLTDLDQEIGEAIFRKKAGGIATNGTESVTVLDSQGDSKEIRFYRAEEVEIWLDLSIQTVTGVFPSDGFDQLKDIIVQEGNFLGVGVDVVVNPVLMSWISRVSGIVGVIVKIGKSENPISDANVEISNGSDGVAEFSSWDASRINITS